MQYAHESPSAFPCRWTVDNFYRAIEAGVFDHPERLELIRGEWFEQAGQNPAQSCLISRLTRRLRARCEPPFTVREASSAAYDPRDKAMLHARAGMPEYWVISLPAEELAVYRKPTSDGYAFSDRRSGEESVAPLSSPETVSSIRAQFDA
jgi:hypothetical protein